MYKTIQWTWTCQALTMITRYIVRPQSTCTAVTSCTALHTLTAVHLTCLTKYKVKNEKYLEQITLKPLISSVA